MEDKNCNTCAHKVGSEVHVLPLECNECYSFKAFPNWKPIEAEKKTCDNCMHGSGKIMNSEYIKQHCYPCIQRSNWEPIKEESYIIKAFKPEVNKTEAVLHPAHYNQGKYEPINVIKDWKLDFDLGNVVKYIARCEYKGNKLQDLNKAMEYLQHEIKSLH